MKILVLQRLCASCEANSYVKMRVSGMHSRSIMTQANPKEYKRVAAEVGTDVGTILYKLFFETF